MIDVEVKSYNRIFDDFPYKITKAGKVLSSLGE
jgi:hypothetical protein